MARLETFPTITAEVTVRLTEGEVRALEALAGYGTDQFLKCFYTQLGEAYLKPHEAGLRSLFELARGPLSWAVTGPTDAARKAFAERLNHQGAGRAALAEKEQG